MFMNLSWRHTLVLFVVVMGFVFIGTGCAGGVIGIDVLGN